MLTRYLFEDLMLSLDGLYTALGIVLRDFYYFQSVDVFCFFPPNQVNLSEGALAQHLQYLEI